MSTKAILFAFAISSLRFVSVAPESTQALTVLQFPTAIGRPPQEANSPQSKSTDRMDDRGCCVLKKSKYKPEWDYSDDETRRLCIDTARKSGFDYDFYKDQKCDRIRQP